MDRSAGLLQLQSPRESYAEEIYRICGFAGHRILCLHPEEKPPPFARKEIGQARSLPEQRILFTGIIRVLDITTISRRFFDNPLSAAKEEDQQRVATALQNKIYLHDYAKNISSPVGNIAHEISVMAWNPDKAELLTGDAMGIVELFQIERASAERLLPNRLFQPAYSAAWKDRHFCVLGTDGHLVFADSRGGQAVFTRVDGLRPVCALKWASDGHHLAVGDADNKVSIFDVRRGGEELLFQYAHKGVIKTLDWSPTERNLLASGDCSSNGEIKFFNLATQSVVATAMMRSSVYQLEWVDGNTLATTHGPSSDGEGSLRILRVQAEKLARADGQKNEWKIGLKKIQDVCMQRALQKGSSLVSMRGKEKLVLCVADTEENRLNFFEQICGIKKKDKEPNPPLLHREESLR